MRIQKDFEELKNKTTRALINADVETLETLGIVGYFPYWGPPFPTFWTSNFLRLLKLDGEHFYTT